MRRIGYLHVAHLPLQRLRATRPALRETPLLIGETVVLDASADCRAAGVFPGMALRTARDLCPEAQVWSSDRLADRGAHEATLALLEEIAPGVEPDGADSAWFDASEFRGSPATAARLAQTLLDQLAARHRLRGRVALGPGKFVTRLAAHRLRDGETLALAPDGVAAYLAPLPVTDLPLRPLALGRLQRLGIATLGAFAALPAEEVPARFGREASPAHTLARGHDDAPLRPRPQPASRVRTRAFEPAVESHEALGAVARRLVAELGAALRADGQAFRALTLIAPRGGAADRGVVGVEDVDGRVGREVGREGQPEQPAVPEVVDVDVQVGEDVRRGVGERVEDLDDPALLGHEHPAVRGELDGRGVGQPAEDDALLEPGWQGRRVAHPGGGHHPPRSRTSARATSRPDQLRKTPGRGRGGRAGPREVAKGFMVTSLAKASRNGDVRKPEMASFCQNWLINRWGRIADIHPMG